EVSGAEISAGDDDRPLDTICDPGLSGRQVRAADFCRGGGARLDVPLRPDRACGAGVSGVVFRVPAQEACTRSRRGLNCAACLVENLLQELRLQSEKSAAYGLKPVPSWLRVRS